MKIARIQTTPLALAFKEPYHWAGRVDHAAAVVLVEVETDDGLVGIGESVAAFPARAPSPRCRASRLCSSASRPSTSNA